MIGFHQVVVEDTVAGVHLVVLVDMAGIHQVIGAHQAVVEDTVAGVHLVVVEVMTDMRGVVVFRSIVFLGALGSFEDYWAKYS